MKHLKVYENWFTDYFKQPEIPIQTQEEIDKQLYDLIINGRCCDTFGIIDLLRKGANPNQIQDEGRGWQYTLLMNVSALKIDKKILEELIKYGADVYYKTDVKDLDYWDWVNKVVEPDIRPKIYNIIKKYHPDFEEERELRKEADKYNL